MTRRTRAPVAAALMTMTLFAAAELAAAPPSRGAQPADSGKAATLVALSYPTQLAQLASMPEADCPQNSACQGLGRLERQMFALVNSDRLNPANAAETKGRALPLKWDPRLAEVALAHSEEMAANGYFSHVDLAGQSPAQRVSEAGVPWQAMGENIAKNYTVNLSEEAFMNEPGFQANHRANILNSKYNYVGIGIVRGADGWLYTTQEFAREP
ncbi:MAG: CAP domain-containing protein [Terriglobia bacterium]